MKYLKILGLAAVAAMALMAFAGSASATVLRSTSGILPAGTEIDASLKAGTSASLTDTAGHTLVTCTASTVKGKTANAGSATETVKGTVEKANLTFGTETTKCTVTVTTTEGGELEIHWISGTTNGTLTAKGFKIDINTVLFGVCTYIAGEGIDLGTLTGSTTGEATMDINAVVKLVSGGGICEPTAKWVGTYTVTTPKPLWVEES